MSNWQAACHRGNWQLAVSSATATATAGCRLQLLYLPTGARKCHSSDSPDATGHHAVALAYKLPACLL